MNVEYFKTIFLISVIPETWPSEFGIVTAFNPMDEKLSDNENSIRNQKLSDEIGDKLFAELIGSSKDFSHQEKSFAIICSMQEAVKLGNDFQQRAIFFVCNGNLKLVDCKSGKSKDLGIFEKKLSIDPTSENQQFHLIKTSNDIAAGT